MKKAHALVVAASALSLLVFGGCITETRYQIVTHGFGNQYYETVCGLFSCSSYSCTGSKGGKDGKLYEELTGCTEKSSCSESELKETPISVGFMTQDFKHCPGFFDGAKDKKTSFNENQNVSMPAWADASDS